MKRSLYVVCLALAFAPIVGAQIEMTASSGGNVGVGAAPGSNARLYVHNNVSGGVSTYGLWSRVLAGNARFGVYGSTTGTASNSATGVYGSGNGSPANRGVTGYASALSGQNAYGLFGSATGAGSVYAGYFSGDVYVTGTVTEMSDARFKEDVRPLGGEEGPDGEAILDRVLRLAPVAYRFTNDERYAHLNLPDGNQYGFLAQDVAGIFPELIGEGHHPTELRPDEDGEMQEVGEPITYQAMNYIHLIPILVQAIQEQQVEIDELRALVEELMGGGN